MSAVDTLKVGVIGLYRGNKQLDAFQRLIDETEVVAACDLDEASMKTVADKHGPIALETLKAGKHAFVEVPLTNSSFANAFQILKASEFTGCRVTVSNQLVWNPRNVAIAA